VDAAIASTLPFLKECIVLVPQCPSPPPSSPNLSEKDHLSRSTPQVSTEPATAHIFASLQIPARPKEKCSAGTGPSEPTSQECQRAQPNPISPTSTHREAPFQPGLFLANLREASTLIVTDVRSFLDNKEISTTWKALVVGGTSAAVIASAVHSVSWGLGALGFVVAKFGGILRENKHNNARGAIQGAILSGHFAGLGSDDMAAGTGIWTVRMLLQSMIPESRRILNATVATTGIGISCAVFCASPTFTAEVALHNLPLAGIILSGIATALPNKLSRTSQAIHLLCNSFMLPYHCAISGSWFLAALSVVWGHGNLKNIFSTTPPEGNGNAKGAEPIDRETSKAGT
jgi:hypothetical protein